MGALAMQILVGSTSQRKVLVAQTIFSRYFGQTVLPVSVRVDSGVSPTPHDQATLDGARNRAWGCCRYVEGVGHPSLERHPPEDLFFVGLESGLVERYGLIFEEAWSCVVTRPRGRAEYAEYVGYSSGLLVPEAVLSRMRASGQPHYEVMEALEVELHLPDDTWANYSGGMLTRQVGLEEALRNAVIQFLPHVRNLYQQEAPESSPPG
jgi:non-canonical (house-cleaning) NTP pyrophosphatase